MLAIVSLVLDGLPFLEWQYKNITALSCHWRWIIAHGTAQNNGSTAWCNAQSPRLSTDGTTEFLKKIARSNRNITVIERQDWRSKDEMANAALTWIKEPCTLMQIDVDEIHETRQLERVHALFLEQPSLGAIKFPCLYYVGKKIVCVGENCWSNKSDEWMRAWRFEQGMRFASHEPPVLTGAKGRLMERGEARRNGLEFQHFSYALEKQVIFKANFYGYSGLLNQWRALQANTVWPEHLQKFFPFVDERVMVKCL